MKVTESDIIGGLEEDLFGKVSVRTSELGPEACLHGSGELARQARREG